MISWLSGPNTENVFGWGWVSKAITQYELDYEVIPKFSQGFEEHCDVIFITVTLVWDVK